MEKAYLTAAGTILTVEARHSAYIRDKIGQEPFPAPFDTPLGFNEVFSLAAMFITGFAPGDPQLPFKAFPPLTLSCSQYVFHQTPSPSSSLSSLILTNPFFLKTKRFPYVSGSSSVTFPNAAQLYPAQDGCPIFAAFFSGLQPVRIYPSFPL